MTYPSRCQRRWARTPPGSHWWCSWRWDWSCRWRRRPQRRTSPAGSDERTGGGGGGGGGGHWPGRQKMMLHKDCCCYCWSSKDEEEVEADVEEEEEEEVAADAVVGQCWPPTWALCSPPPLCLKMTALLLFWRGEYVYRFIYQQLLLGVEGRAELIGGEEEEEEEEVKEVMRKACTAWHSWRRRWMLPLIDGRHRAVLHKKQYH